MPDIALNPRAGMDSLYSASKPGFASIPKTGDAGGETPAESPEGPTGVIDLKVLTGPDGQPPQEGAEVTVRIVKIYGNEAEVTAISPAQEEAQEPAAAPGPGPLPGLRGRPLSAAQRTRSGMGMMGGAME